MGTLSEVAHVIMGQSPSGDRCSPLAVGTPLLNGPSEFGVYHPIPVQWTNDPKRIATPGALLFCVRGSTTGRMNWADQEYAIGRGLAGIVHKSGLEYQPWLRGVIEHRLPELLTSATGSTFPNVSREQLFGLEIPDHGPEVQREIAAILGALDDKIEVNRKASATLEAMARALYRSWFVDFDPVWAKLEGRTPAHMPPATAALFPDRFGDDGLPLGWSFGTLADLIDFNPRERITKGTIAPYFDMRALPTSGLNTDAPIQREFSSGTKFRAMDTLLARITPCLENGKTAMVPDLGDQEIAWGSTEFIVMRARPDVPASLPYCVARDPAFRDEAIATMTGSSGRQRADATRISEMPIAIPDPEIISEFGNASVPLIDRIHQFNKEIKTLAALRDSLLPKLMSGEIRVGDARELAEVAV